MPSGKAYATEVPRPLVGVHPDEVPPAPVPPRAAVDVNLAPFVAEEKFLSSFVFFVLSSVCPVARTSRQSPRQNQGASCRVVPLPRMDISQRTRYLWVENIKLWKDVTGAVHTGQIVDDGYLNGCGKITFLSEGKDGEVKKDGVFVDGRLNGHGKFTLADGDVLEGVFVNNCLNCMARLCPPNASAPADPIIKLRPAEMVNADADADGY
ncbi:hypothetical protein THAOC_03128 [Thalassiosira oceanica]|uniref:Uncharacterized protein n=1 Tax=Thalassiosira oceanica TaxID=159749 RepID=K0TDG9_THAOC|nr:hypothetical protein THAOC_03128 [Thalassiosira oceanica]|eukprot:EJK75159.1 hypothetical protein THAOC_03128 [Thalassiosira oceanica]